MLPRWRALTELMVASISESNALIQCLIQCKIYKQYVRYSQRTAIYSPEVHSPGPCAAPGLSLLRPSVRTRTQCARPSVRDRTARRSSKQRELNADGLRCLRCVRHLG